MSENRWSRRWRQPLLVLPLLVVFMLVVGEFYPFSDFPMYSDPDPDTTYYIFLGDADALDEGGLPRPIAMQYLVGIRAAKAKKILWSNLKARARELGKGAGDLSDEELRQVAAATLAYFRAREEHMGTADQMPARLALVRGEVDLALGEGIRERWTVLAEEEGEE